MISDIIKRVVELDGKATKGPWVHDRGRGVFTRDERHVARAQRQEDRAYEEDAALIADYRRSAPILAKVLAVAIEALNAYDARERDTIARSALAEIERIAGER